MEVRIPKLMTSGKKSMKNLNHKSSSTFEAGFCQPISCTELEAQSNIKYRCDQWCYLSPCSAPTFGVVNVKTYNNFVPIEDIYHAFGALLSGQSYHGSGNSYVPLNVPMFFNGFLCAFIRAHGNYCIWEVSSPVTVDGTTSFGTSHTLVASGAQTSIIDKYCSDVLSRFYFDGKTYFQGATGAPVLTKCLYKTDLEPTGSDWLHYVTLNNKHYIIFGRFGTFSRNLHKISVGLGLEPLMAYKTKSILPFIAYYKTWFDLFMPKRVKTWKDTNAFSLMEMCEQNGYTNISQQASARARLLLFLDDLGRTYYTDNVDFISAHTVGQVNDIAGTGQVGFTYEGAQNDSNTLNHAGVGVSGEERNQAIVKPDNASSPGISQTGLNVLKAVTQRLNIKSALGGRIDAILRSLFGSDYRNEDESFFIGTQNLPVIFTPVMNQAQTPQGDLGEYAGRGMSDAQGKEFTYEAKVPGYFISFVVIVPDGKPSQGSDMMFDHVDANSFYNPSYDSITLLPSRKEYIYGTQDAVVNGNPGDDSLEDGFGNIVNYIEYKTHKSYINGDMRLMSTRDSFLPFTLAKLMPYTKVKVSSSGGVNVFNMLPSLLVASDLWRYIGLYPWYGNFNRIFLNAAEYADVNTNVQDYSIYWNRTDDNYILHSDIKMSKLSYSLSVADSWQTEAYGDSFKVEKA